MKRVVVTGLGAVGPCGNDVDSTWDSSFMAARVLAESRILMPPIGRFRLPVR